MMRYIKYLDYVCHESALDNVFQEEFWCFEEVLRKLKLKVVNAFMGKVKEKIWDSSSLSDGDEYCIDHHVKELFKQVVSMSHWLIFYLFIIWSSVDKPWNKYEVK